MTQIIINNQVECPHCHEVIEVKRKAGGGASYVQDWKKINKKNLQIITVWLSNGMHGRLFSKPDLRIELDKRGVYVSEDAINGRISELLGLNLVKSTKHEKDDPHNTSKKPLYYLNIRRAANVVNNEGWL